MAVTIGINPNNWCLDDGPELRAGRAPLEFPRQMGCALIFYADFGGRMAEAAGFGLA